ncbi:hypothetical protein C2S52_010570 [Perilla frutescens var. hirtella]|nr:hypothetical protein C2S52_010570 [Perilla frutescens var. hirtella]
MAPVFGTIDMLKPGRSTFGLELRLIRCYENSNSGGVECIFHDRQAERIHVIIPGSNFEKFKHRLIEGTVYVLLDFMIGLNIMKYRTTSCIHKIIVFKHTRLFEFFQEEFPKCLFELKTFADIAQMENVGDSAMFDVIGAIVSHYRPQQKEINGKMTKLMDILLEGVEGNIITCTVWEHYVDEVIKFLDSGPEAPVGIIMQLCRASIFRGSLNDQIKDGDFEMKTISEILSEGKGRRIDEIPEEIEKVANRKALFNVSVQSGQTSNYTGSFSVARICCDRVIIEKVCGKRFSIEEEGSVSKIGAENAEEMDQVLDIQPTEIDEIVGAKGFFKIIVMHEKMKGPFIVVKESVRRSKGKRKMHGDADEAAYICDALETPPIMKSTTERKNLADLINEDETNRKLIDEFSSNALKKRQKRNVKKE